MPLTGTVPERLLAIADRIAEPERYRKRMLELATAPGESTIDEFEVAGTGRVLPRVHGTGARTRTAAPQVASGRCAR